MPHIYIILLNLIFSGKKRMKTKRNTRFFVFLPGGARALCNNLEVCVGGWPLGWNFNSPIVFHLIHDERNLLLGQFTKSISLNFIFALESFRSLQRAFVFYLLFFWRKVGNTFCKNFYPPLPPSLLPFLLPLQVNGETAYDFPRSFFRHIFNSV